MTRILITGASGFVGRHLMAGFAGSGRDLRIAGRRRPGAGDFPFFGVGDIGPATDWSEALEGCSAVIHLAGQVPAHGVDPARYRAVNDEATRRLAEQARAAGVTRLVFLSSIFAATDGNGIVAGNVPDTDYGRSKRAAEAHVADFARDGRIGIVLRPPLVYGAGAGGNWAALVRLAALPVPLPFGLARNRRSVIAVENLADALVAAVDAPAGQGLSGVHALADDGPVGTADIISLLRQGMGRRPSLLPVPPDVLVLPLRLAGMARMADSLFGDLVVDATGFAAAFGWRPRVSTAEAIRAAGSRHAAEARGSGH